MKPGIHPEYHAVEATCVCGNVILTGSTRSAVKMDICSACHPFFTGTQRIVDTEGRVEKFKKRYTQAEALNKTKKTKKEQAKQDSASDQEGQQSPDQGKPEQPESQQSPVAEASPEPKADAAEVASEGSAPTEPAAE